MALAPKFKGHRLLFSKEASAASFQEPLHTIEVFLDYVCPFSAKFFKTLYSDVVPRVRASPGLATKLQVIFRQQIQPWHPSSTLVHEAGLAVARLAPDRFYGFSEALFRAQTDYFDASVANEKRNDTYRRLARLAAGSAGVDEAAVYDLLAVSDKPGPDGGLNSGNKVTDDLKVLVKTARLVGVHVTPTVIFDGVVTNIDSSWTADQWLEWLEKNVA